MRSCASQIRHQKRNSNTFALHVISSSPDVYVHVRDRLIYAYVRACCIVPTPAPAAPKSPPAPASICCQGHAAIKEAEVAWSKERESLREEMEFV